MRNTDHELFPNSATRGRQYITNEPLARMHTVPLGIKDNTVRVQTAVCLLPPAVQGNNSFSGTGKFRTRFTGGNYLSFGEKSDTSGSERAKPQWILLEVFSSPEERDASSPTHIRSESIKQIPKAVQVQNAHSFHTPETVAPRRLVHVHRPEGRVFSHKYISTPQEIPKVCIPGGGIRVLGSPLRTLSQPKSVCQMYRSGFNPAKRERHSSRYVHRRLAGSGSIGTERERTHTDAGGASTETGLEIEHRKECFNSHAVNNIFGSVTGLSRVQGAAVRGESGKIHSMSGHVSEGKQCSLSYMPKIIRTDGLVINSHSVRQTIYEGIPALGCFTKTRPLTTLSEESEGYVRSGAGTAPVEAPILSDQRDANGGHSVQKGHNDGRVAVRLGGHSRGQISEREMGPTSIQSPHKLSGNAGRLSVTETFSPIFKGASCPREDGQYHSGGIHKPSGRSQITPLTHVGTQTDFMGQCQPLISESDACTGGNEPGCRSAFQGQSSVRGLGTEQGSGRSDLAQIWHSDSGPVRVLGQCAVPSVFLHKRSERTSGDRCVSARMAPHSPLCVSSDSINTPCSRQSEDGRVEIDINSSALAGEVLAGGDHTYAIRRAVVSSDTKRSAVTGRGRDFSSTPGTPGTMGLASEWFNLNATGLPDSVIRTIQNARASSTRSLYDCKWGVFERWCADKHEIPFQCSVAVILSFLQNLIDQRKAFSTIKVFLAAISACHIGFDGKTVGQHPLVCRFMKGARRALPVSRPLSPSWDLELVLDSLSAAPFEPLDKADLKVLSFKTALLLALASAKRVSEIHALSVHSACMQFMQGDVGVALKPNPAFMPKVINAIAPLELRAFYPPPFASVEQQKLNSLCPVRALRMYVSRTEGFRQSDQLFVSWAKPRSGQPITKQRLSHWIVDAISLAYSSKGLTAPSGLRAHSTRGMSTSWALFKGVTIQDICDAASWSSPHTFARFYKLDVTAQTLAHAVLSVGS
nr:uncharacterized protein LOC129423361 [Misgurnus anguillicaudatus]